LEAFNLLRPGLLGALLGGGAGALLGGGVSSEESGANYINMAWVSCFSFIIILKLRSQPEEARHDTKLATHRAQLKLLHVVSSHCERWIC
jgi:hypothetical protein